MMIETYAQFKFQENVVPGGLVIGEPSRVLDAWSQSPLLLVAPEFHYPPFHMSFGLGEGESDNPSTQATSRRTWLPRRAPARAFSGSTIVFDVRHDDNGNVAHILQNLR